MIKIVQKILNFPEVHVVTVPERISSKVMTVLMNPIETNKAKIINIGNDIEREMTNIIRVYFFGHSLEASANEFQHQILESDWCSFAAKKKLLSHIVNTKNYIKGEDKGMLEKLLKETMSYRNAFAHGRISTDGKQVTLRYFEGRTIEKILDDEYFTKAEKVILDCWQLLARVAGASKTYQNVNF